MKPPYTITPSAVTTLLNIAEILGHLKGIQLQVPQPELRKKNRIKTIHASLAIEGNTLSTDHITAILNDQRVIGPEREIIEVVNAIKTYDSIQHYKWTAESSILKAHKTLMTKLLDDAGNYRAGNVGIFNGSNVTHVAPPSSQVPRLMKDLFAYLKTDKETHTLIKSCVFHYELLFIHPFSDGNGRMARLWQTVILMQYHPVFEYVPVESLIAEQQKNYYRILEACDSQGDSTAFIEFILSLLLQALTEMKNEVSVQRHTSSDRLSLAREHFNQTAFSRKAYIQFHKTISTATASRDLKEGVDQKQLDMIGTKAQTRYRFI